MKKLSIFIDESGDFGEVKERLAYYLATFVFHDQDNNIDQQVKKLEDSIKSVGFDVEYIHTGPVIRREEIFARYSIFLWVMTSSLYITIMDKASLAQF